jgi:outer membrane protein assembly factor BamB
MKRALPLLLVVLPTCILLADEIDKKYPLDTPLRILAEDLENPRYRELVTKKMLTTDLDAEWQRAATADNPESFLEKHGGKDKVFADPDLKAAYERRVEIRKRYLDLMREGYARYKKTAPFDQGKKVDPSTTITKTPAGSGAALAPILSAAGAEKNWPGFRGPTGQGLTGLSELPTVWDKEGKNIVWRVKVPLAGNSSPVIWGDRIFLTGSAAKGEKRSLMCFERSTGKLLWTREAPATEVEPGVRDKNGFASATPVTDGERVVVFLGSCGILCWDFDGKLLWHYDKAKFNLTHGTGSSPVLYKDKVLFVHDQNKVDSVFIALDKKTGNLLWQQKRPKAMTWSSPTLVRVGDHDEFIFAGAEKVVGYDPDTGKELWSLDGPTYEVIPVVIAGKDLLYSASGRNGPVIALRPGGKGDVTETHLVWKTARGGPHVPSPIYLDGRLYFANDTGILTCLDGTDGKLIWQTRLPANFSASPIEAGGLLYFPSEAGITFVVKAGDRYRLVAQNDLGSPILASPAVAGGQIFLRTEEELVCIGKKP